LAALVLLGVLAVVFVAMGNWQLGRAAQRTAMKQAILQGRNAPPLRLTPATPASELIDWRPATVTGAWQHAYTVLLDNRNYKGRPGFWVATPLLIDSSTNTAVLVLRGWIPRPIRLTDALPVIPAPQAAQTITGDMLGRVPRMFELWSFSNAAQETLPARLPTESQALPRVQNLSLDAYAAATGLKLLPVVLEQTSDAMPVDNAHNASAALPTTTSDSGSAPRDLSAAAVLLREWPEPSVDADQNKGYALQWFSFAAIAIGAWLYIAWRALRRRPSPSGHPPSP
jgi:cytochrome oxidase assembly protein ShyY1